MHEIESCINSHPLTFTGDGLDSSVPLTPAHFLNGKVVGFQPEVSLEDLSVSSSDLNDRYIIQKERINQFWEIWSKDYLRNLPQTSNRFFHKGNLEPGSVVLIKEDNVPRLEWPLGVVQTVFPGKDGNVRSVSLKTRKGILKRPIQLLYDLELKNQQLDDNPETPVVSDLPANNDRRVSRFGRKIRPVSRFTC